MPMKITAANVRDGVLQSVTVKVRGVAAPMEFGYSRGAWFKPNGDRCHPAVEARLTDLWIAWGKAEREARDGMA